MSKKGIHETDIAFGLRVTAGLVNHCISIDPKTNDFRRKGAYVREGVARYLGLTYKELWGEDSPLRNKKQSAA